MAPALNRAAWFGWIATLLIVVLIVVTEFGPAWKLTGSAAEIVWNGIYLNWVFAAIYILTFGAASRA